MRGLRGGWENAKSNIVEKKRSEKNQVEMGWRCMSHVTSLFFVDCSVRTLQEKKAEPRMLEDV